MNVRRRLLRSSVSLSTEAFYIGASTFAISIINVLFIGLTSRTIGVDELGAVNSFIALISAIGVIAPLGIPRRLQHIFCKTAGTHDLNTELISGLINSLIYQLVFVGILIQLWISGHVSLSSDWVRFLAITLMTSIALLDTTVGHLTSLRKLLLISLLGLLEPVVRLILLWSMAKVQLAVGIDAIIISYTISSTFNCVACILILSNINLPLSLSLSLSSFIEGVKSFPFGVPACARSLSSWMPIIVLGTFVDGTTAGIYFTFSRLVSVTYLLPAKFYEIAVVPRLYSSRNKLMIFMREFNKSPRSKVIAGTILLFGIICFANIALPSIQVALFPSYLAQFNASLVFKLLAVATALKFAWLPIESFMIINGKSDQLSFGMGLSTLLIASALIVFVLTTRFYDSSYLSSPNGIAGLTLMIELCPFAYYLSVSRSIKT